MTRQVPSPESIAVQVRQNIRIICRKWLSVYMPESIGKTAYVGTLDAIFTAKTLINEHLDTQEIEIIYQIQALHTAARLLANLNLVKERKDQIGQHAADYAKEVIAFFDDDTNQTILKKYLHEATQNAIYLTINFGEPENLAGTAHLCAINTRIHSLFEQYELLKQLTYQQAADDHKTICQPKPYDILK